MSPSSDRKYPLKQPLNYKAPVIRWMLEGPRDITHIYTLYVGVQSHGATATAIGSAVAAVHNWLQEAYGMPAAIDQFRVTEGFDVVDSRVWVAYWSNAYDFWKKPDRDLKAVWNSLVMEREAIGLWTEAFATPIERLETNYARIDHKPGIAQLEGFTQQEHNLSAYWGAGRDRIPASAEDLFEKPTPLPQPQSRPKALGARLTGSNYDNMCHIRSGQWWVQCDEEERRAYEQDLQGTLMEGMRYLWEHPQETGTIGLRFLQNLDDSENPINETCGAGFFRNWADLEKWSSRHPSHLAIFNGAHRHAKKFGEKRKFMTWHEVSILKAGEVRFDYVNCDPSTGVIGWVRLEQEALVS